MRITVRQRSVDRVRHCGGTNARRRRTSAGSAVPLRARPRDICPGACDVAHGHQRLSRWRKCGPGAFAEHACGAATIAGHRAFNQPESQRYLGSHRDMRGYNRRCRYRALSIADGARGSDARHMHARRTRQTGASCPRWRVKRHCWRYGHARKPCSRRLVWASAKIRRCCRRCRAERSSHPRRAARIKLRVACSTSNCRMAWSVR